MIHPIPASMTAIIKINIRICITNDIITTSKRFQKIITKKGEKGKSNKNYFGNYVNATKVVTYTVLNATIRKTIV
jgi:hypothetical protein